MASGNFISSTGVNLNVLVYWSSVANVAGNYSTVYMDVYLRHYSLTVGARSAGNSVVADGSSQGYSTPAYSFGNTLVDTLMTSKSFIVYHNADGTKSCGLSAGWYFNGTYGGKFMSTITASATVTLDAIPRATNISNVVGDYMGSEQTIYATPAVSGFTHTLRYNCQGTTGTIATGLTGASIAQAWTVPLSLASIIPNGYLVSIDLILDTYNGGTLLGSSTYPKLIRVPDSVIPTITAFAGVVDEDAVSEAWNKFIKGKSKIAFSWSGLAGIYGSTIVSWAITATGYSYAGTSSASSGSFLSIKINHVGALTFTLSVTDSRGRVGTKTLVITGVDYASPVVASFSASRGTGGTKNDDGTQTITSQVFSFSSCGGSNALTVQKVNIMELPSGAYGAGVTVITGVDKICTGTFSADLSFYVRLTLKDAYGAVYAYATISPSFSIMEIYGATGKGIAFGESASEDSFNVNLPAKFKQGLTFSVDAFKYIPATAGSNGDFKVTLFGTLATNQIVYILFPTATNGASNARLSVNNGATYKNISLVTTRLASEVQNLALSFVYSGTSFIPLETEYFPIAFTPTDGSGAGLTFTAVNPCGYVKVGKLVTFSFDITFPATSNTAYARINFPSTPHSIISLGGIGYHNLTGKALVMHAQSIYNQLDGYALTNANLSEKRITATVQYISAT